VCSYLRNVFIVQRETKIRGTACCYAFAVPSERAFKASNDVRHLNVVDVVP